MRTHDNTQYILSASVAAAIVTGSYTSSPMRMSHGSMFSLTLNCSGTVYGTGSLEGCNDPAVGIPFNPNKLVNWVTITSPVTTVQRLTGEPAAGVTPLQIDIAKVCCEYLRFKFVPSTDVRNSGSFSAMATVKGTI